MCAGVWARMAGGRRSGSVSKRENQQYSLGWFSTFRLDKSVTTTTLPSLVLRSTRPLRRNSTTLIGHGDINKTILLLLVDFLTLRLQRLPTKSRLGCTSLSRCIIIFITNNQRNSPRATIVGRAKLKETKLNETIIQLPVTKSH